MQRDDYFYPEMVQSCLKTILMRFEDIFIVGKKIRILKTQNFLSFKQLYSLELFRNVVAIFKKLCLHMPICNTGIFLGNVLILLNLSTESLETCLIFYQFALHEGCHKPRILEAMA